MESLFTVENLVALLTLTGLEIVLGIDNVVFIAVLTAKLPAYIQPRARRVGLSLAMITRVLLLLCISWIVRLDKDLFHVAGQGFSGHDLILLAGGLFLIAKATFEIHEKVEGHAEHHGPARAASSFASVIVQILLIDMVFSLDSVITAVGMARAIPVMIAAVIAAVFVMLAFAGAISGFVERHPTMKILALSFLVLIGVLLVAEGFGKHIEKGYVYFAMAFALGVELVNLRVRGTGQAVQLHQPHMPERPGAQA